MTRSSAITTVTGLGFAVQQARIRAGLTQAELADELGTDQAYVSRLESGASVKAISRLLEALAVTGARLEVIFPDGDDD